MAETAAAKPNKIVRKRPLSVDEMRAKAAYRAMEK